MCETAPDPFKMSSDQSALLNESFGRFFSYGLQPDSAVGICEFAGLSVYMRSGCKVISCLSVQAFKSYFPSLPEPVVEALFDLYRQVLLHVEINSKVM